MPQSIPNNMELKGRVFPEIEWSEAEKVRNKVRQQDFYQRCWAIFEKLKPELLDKYYGWYIAIEPDSEDYFIDPDKELASRKAREKYPQSFYHLFGINETGVTGRI